MKDPQKKIAKEENEEEEEKDPNKFVAIKKYHFLN